VHNQQGIFLTYVKRSHGTNNNKPGVNFYGKQDWFLMRSTDAGASFQRGWPPPGAHDPLAPQTPALETDEDGNVYAFAIEIYSAQQPRSFALQPRLCKPDVDPTIWRDAPIWALVTTTAGGPAHEDRHR